MHLCDTLSANHQQGSGYSCNAQSHDHDGHPMTHTQKPAATHIKQVTQQQPDSPNALELACCCCFGRCADHLLVAPQRKAPPAELVAAVTRAAAPRGPGGGGTGDDDDDEERVVLPPGAPRWEAAVVELLRGRARCPDWVLEWVVSGAGRGLGV